MLKLIYIGKMDMGDSFPNEDLRLWNVLSPQLPGFNYKYGSPTLGMAGLREWGII